MKRVIPHGARNFRAVELKVEATPKDDLHLWKLGNMAASEGFAWVTAADAMTQRISRVLINWCRNYAFVFDQN